MVGSIIALALGAYILVVSIRELAKRLRASSRQVRVPGVIVGRRDARGEDGMSPATHTRAAMFRFTTVDGEVIETESNVHSFPGPRLGKRVRVIYDPRDPYDADTTGRTVVLIVGMLIGALVGAALVTNALLDLG